MAIGPPRPFTSIHFINVPFDASGAVDPENRILQEIENTILLIKRELTGPLALSHWPDQNWRAYFPREHILAIDLLTWPEGTSLSVLQQSITRFPMCAINLCAELTSERLLGLEAYMREHRWILPVFPYFPQNGVWQIGRMYAQPLLDILHGTAPPLDLEQLRGPAADMDIGSFKEALLRDFPCLREEAGKVSAVATRRPFGEHSIRWVGAPNETVEVGMGRIYDSNHDTIPLSDVGAFFSHNSDDTTAFVKIARRSTFFYVDEQRSVLLPRFLRKNIHAQILTSLAWELQRRLVQHHAASADLHPTVFGPLVRDYHDIQSLFARDQEYGRKLSYLARQETRAFQPFDAILTFDDGRQSYFADQIAATFQVRVVRCIRSGQTIRLYPFHNLRRGEKVLLLCDVLNKGQVARQMLELAERDCNACVVGVFGYVVNSVADRALPRSTGGPPVPLRSFVRKQLESVAVAAERIQPREDLRDPPEAERFMLFWEMVDITGTVRSQVSRSREIVLRSEKDERHCKREFCHVVSLDTPAANQGRFLRDICARVAQRLGEGDYDRVIANRDTASLMLARTLKQQLNWSGDVTPLHFSTVSNDQCRDFREGRVLLVDTGINTFHNLRRVTEALIQAGMSRERLDALALFRRTNATREFDTIVSLERQRCESHCNLFIYYESCLPVYLIPLDAEYPWQFSPHDGRREDWKRVSGKWHRHRDLAKAVEMFLTDVPSVGSSEAILGEDALK